MNELFLYDTSVVTRALYIHWPFCPYKCHFCPFVAYSGYDAFMKPYHNALVKEIEEFAKATSCKQRLDTIFLGGGTPSTYPDELLLDTFGRIRDVFLLEDIQEVTIEINPGTVRAEQLAIWKKAGINRLSIGVQTLNDAVLKTLNRWQSATEVEWLIQTAQHEFDNISIDLIMGLPGISAQEWKHTLEQVVQWPISHISIYFLTIHEGTALYFKVQRNTVTLPPDDEVVDLYMWSIEYLAKHGFEQYEISNFARKGRASIHNQQYWNRTPFKGFGVGAWSFDGKRRAQNEKRLNNYIALIEQSQEVITFTETLTSAQEHLEKVMLGLRRAQGITIQELCSKKDAEHIQILTPALEACIQEGFINRSDDRIHLTARGLAIHQSVVTKLSCEHEKHS